MISTSKDISEEEKAPVPLKNEVREFVGQMWRVKPLGDAGHCSWISFGVCQIEFFLKIGVLNRALVQS